MNSVVHIFMQLKAELKLEYWKIRGLFERVPDAYPEN